MEESVRECCNCWHLLATTKLHLANWLKQWQFWLVFRRCLISVSDGSFDCHDWGFLGFSQSILASARILPVWPQLSSQLTLYSLSYWLCHLNEVQRNKFYWNCCYFQAANQEEIINILQDSVNIAQKEQQDLRQKLKDAVSSYRTSTLGTVLQMPCDSPCWIYCWTSFCFRRLEKKNYWILYKRKGRR